MVRSIAVPENSIASALLEGAYFFDSFEAPVHDPDQKALDIYLAVIGMTPGWVDFLMALRNRTVALFGVKNLGHLNAVPSGTTPHTYQVGDRVGIFSILALSSSEIIVGDSDKHLNARVSVYKYFAGGQNKVAVTTVVHLNNFFGRVYLFFVVPAHKIIMRALLSRFAAVPRKE